MAFEMRYPTSTAPLQSWLPSDDPLVKGGFPEDPGYIRTRGVDKRTVHVDEVSRLLRQRRYRFEMLPDADRVSFTTFQNVTLGRSCHLLDGFTTPAYVTVKIVHWEWIFSPEGGLFWDLDLIVEETDDDPA